MKYLIRLLAICSPLLFTDCQQISEPAPCGPIPTQAQLQWHKLEYYAFVHFNMNTFTDEEWGYGDEKPASFNPTELSCKQWVNTFKKAGMKAVIITARHHDGFCLWPTKTTNHSIKNSSFKNGQGDIIKELSDACKEAGLKFGVYLSPWDRNSEFYGKPEYINIFREQLKELLTNYGDIFEVWFDGANGGTGYYGGAKEERKIDRKTYYDWENTYNIIRELQPNACIFGDGGPEVRWVGNEEGWAGETNWSIIKHKECYAGMPNYHELSYGHEDGTKWVPAECDVSIRPGWYYHSREDHLVKSLDELVDIYYHSVGRNASLLLNFPVDRRGLVHENDAQRVLELAKVIEKDFANNLATDAKISTVNTRQNNDYFKVDNLIDDNKDTYWATDDNITEAVLLIEFDNEQSFNRLMLQEYIPLGQRIQAFQIEAYIDNKWQLIDTQTTVGAKRILRFPSVTTNKIKLSITKAKACLCISEIGIFDAPKLLIQPLISRNIAGIVNIHRADEETTVYYTLDGSEPNANSNLFTQPFLLTGKGIVKAIAIDSKTQNSSSISTQTFDIAPTNWTVINMEDEKANNLLDGNTKTSFTIKNDNLLIDLGEQLTLNGFTYLPDQSRWGSNYILSYSFYVSADGKNWGSPVAHGEFSNIENSPIKQEVHFNTKKGRFIKLVPHSIARGDKAFSVAEFRILTE